MVLIVLDGRNCLDLAGLEAGRIECNAVGSCRFVSRPAAIHGSFFEGVSVLCAS